MSGLLEEPFGGHPGRVRSVAVTPDGRKIVSGGEDGTVRVWDLASATEERTIDAHLGGVRSVAVIAGGARIITVGVDGDVREWDLGVPGEHASAGWMEPAVDQREVWNEALVSVTPDGRHAVSGGRHGKLTRWSLEHGLQRIFRIRTSPMCAVGINPDGSQAVTGSEDGTIRMYDLDRVDTVRALHGMGVPQAVALTPDGSRVVLGSSDGTIRWWDWKSGIQREVAKHPGGVFALAVTPDGTRIVSGGGDGTVRVWDTETGAAAGPPLVGHAGGVRALAVTRDGRQLVSGGGDRLVRVWDLRSGTELRTLAGLTGGVRALALSPDGSQILACGSDAVVWVWDTATGAGRAVPTQHHGVVYAAVFAKGGLVITGGIGGEVGAWSTESGTGHVAAIPHSGWIRALAVLPDGTGVVIGGDRTARIWNLTAGSVQKTFGGKGIRAVAVTADGTRIVTGNQNGAVQLWDLTGTGEPLALTGHPGAVCTVAAAKDGKVIAGGEGGVLLSWDPGRNPSQPSVLNGHTARVRALAVTPDQRQLISGGDDGTIRIWDRARCVQVAGTGFTAPPPAPPRAGVTSDEESADDLLGFSEDVGTLASLVTDRATEPPLCIALLGPWGSGKSSFMRQLHDQVELRADLSRNNPGRSVYAATVRQVRFNAWHYSDDHLWVGLVEHLFGNLTDSSALPDGQPDPENLRTSLADMRTQQDKLEQELERASAGGVFRIPTLLRLLWSRHTAERRRRRRALLIGAAVTVLAAAAAVTGWLLWDNSIAVVTGAALAIIAMAAAITPTLTSLAKGWRSVAKLPGTLREKIESRKRDLDREIRAAAAELDQLDAAERLAGLIDQVRSGRYDQYRGLLGQVHGDLRRLSDDMRVAFTQWQQAGSQGPPPLERIVLYVDDLDRCAPRKVVDVLAAVHLLLALPLFVVVVAVDPRWLRRALEQHHIELFDSTVAPAGERPLEYLDKIFQVPFALRPMGSAADEFIKALLPPALPEPASAAQPAPAEEQSAPEPAAASVTTPREPEEDRQDVRSAREAALPSLLDPQPDRLRLRAAERDFLRRLRPLLDTPRAVKKLVNLYRLVRTGIADHDLPEFVGRDGAGPYQAVLTLLAVTVAAPSSARVLVAALHQDGDGDIVDLLRRLDSDCPAGPRLAGLIETIRQDTAVHGDLASYRTWAGTIARFSFETYDLVTER